MRFALLRRPIDVSALLDEVQDASRGATAVFVGTVRGVNEGREVRGIEYSAYDAMAVREMERILADAASRFDGAAIILEHRLGELLVGEASMAVVVGHARRTPAMDAMRYVVEEVKRRVPIWKLEQYLDGTREWVDPTAGHAA